MANASNKLAVAVLAESAVIKVRGRANAPLSVQFKSLAAELRDTGRKNLVVDLGECEMMDSTFLGVLAGLVANVTPGSPQESRFGVRLLNTCPRVMDLLENLGVDQLFKFVQEPPPAVAASTPTGVEETPTSKETLSRTCLEAHQLLMALNPDNVPKFKDVTQFLAEDLKKASNGESK